MAEDDVKRGAEIAAVATVPRPGPQSEAAKELFRVREALRAANETIAALREQVKNLIVQVAEIPPKDAEIKRLQGVVTEKIEQISALKRAVRELSDKVRNMEVLEAEIESLLGEKREISVMTQENRRLERVIKTKDDDIAQRDRRIGELSVRVRVLEARAQAQPKVQPTAQPKTPPPVPKKSPVGPGGIFKILGIDPAMISGIYEMAGPDGVVDYVKGARKRLVGTIHPDKIKDPAQKKAAEALMKSVNGTQSEFDTDAKVTAWYQAHRAQKR